MFNASRTLESVQCKVIIFMSNKSNSYRLDPSTPHSDIFRCVFERRLSGTQKDIIEDDKNACCYKVGWATLWAIGYEDEPPYGYSHSDLNRGF